MTDEEKLTQVGLLGARTALACAELTTLILTKLIPACPDDVAVEAFFAVKEINAKLQASLEAFDSEEAVQ